ncbi:hypothetical protein FACS1894166_03180 [Bacilli bacterium]|nr:hypothetical protein FACS1894166_03180 [Bacilli bacterium]
MSVEDCQSDFGTSTTRGECSESADTNANPLASKWLFSCQGYKSEFEANNAGAKNYVFTNTSGNHNGGAAY